MRDIVFFMVLKLRRTNCRKFQDDLDNCPFQKNADLSNVRQRAGFLLSQLWVLRGGLGLRHRHRPATGDPQGRQRGQVQGLHSSTPAPPMPHCSRSPGYTTTLGPPREQQWPCVFLGPRALPSGEELGGLKHGLCLCAHLRSFPCPGAHSSG